MKSKSTPGPWTGGDVYKRNNRLAGRVGIACGASQEEAEANARLIAKAWLIPELVEACKGAERELAAWEPGSFDSDTMAAPLASLRAVLAKFEAQP